MDDVIHEVGGFLPVYIPNHGMILRQGGLIVHLETRGLHELPTCVQTLSQAVECLQGQEDACVLELTPDGGGARVWMRPEQVPILEPRLNRYRACYGGWAVTALTGI